MSDKLITMDPGEAQVDHALFDTRKGRIVEGSGSVAQRLMANNFNANALRTNDTLQYDEWKEIDRTVLEISKDRLVGVGDLVNAGCVYNIPNGMGSTVLLYQDASDMEDAHISMDAREPGQADRVEFDTNYLPLFITHKGFTLNIRVLQASRSQGQPLDTTLAAMAARKVAERVETILFTGASTYTYGGGVVYGYTDFTHSTTGSLDTNWDDSGADPLKDALAMVKAAYADKHYGPFTLYVPTNFAASIEDDYNTTYPSRTVRERLQAIDVISAVKVADKLTDDNVILVEMKPDTVRMVIGLQPTTVQWESGDGMQLHFKVMTIMVPQLRADQDDRSGIVHYS